MTTITEPPSIAEVTEQAPPPARPRTGRVKAVVFHLMMWSIALGVASAAAVEGLRLRWWVFSETPSIRHRGDIDNAWRWGSTVLDESRKLANVPANAPVTWKQLFDGYVSIYIRLYNEREKNRWELDYAPMRLAVMSVWVKHVKDANPTQNRWQQEDLIPLVRFNTAMTAVAAFAAFALVYAWLRRAMTVPISCESFPQRLKRTWRRWRRWEMDDAAPPAVEHRPSVSSPRVVLFALVAALLVWFDPAVIVGGHGWPQWDVWLLPFYLLAAWLATTSWWFTAGVVIGVGAMFKGQLLICTPVLILWPIFQARFLAAARILTGIAAGFALVASPWLLHNPAAWPWLATLMAAVAVAAGMVFVRRRAMSRKPHTAPETRSLDRRQKMFKYGAIAGFICVIVALVAWPWFSAASRTHWTWALALATVIAAAPIFIRRREIAFFAAMILTAGVGLAALRYEGSFAWWHMGFGYGTERYSENIAMGPVNNLPVVLGRLYGWKNEDWVDLSWIHEHVNLSWLGIENDWSFRQLLRYTFAAMLVMCAMALAWHHSRRRTAGLVAIAAPWVIMFALLPQMHERYLLYGAGITSIVVGHSIGLGLLHILVSLCATGMMFHSMLSHDRNYWPEMLRTLQGMHPGVGWAVFLMAMVFFFCAIWPGRKRRALPAPTAQQ